MASLAPTRLTLRHLRRMCSSPETIATSHVVAIANRSNHAGCQSPRHSPRNQDLVQRRNHTKAFSTTRPALQERPSATTTSNHASTKEAPSAPLPDITNFYTLFPNTIPSGPPPSGPFAIPLPALKREFLLLQSQHHPDKYTASANSHSKSVALSSLVNSAYKTLSDPLLRARYLLAHNYNIDITSEDNATHRGVTDHTTLMEVMEAQEAIEEAETQDEIDALKAQNRKRIVEAEEKLGEAFEREDVEVAKTECVRLNYWRSLQQGLDDWEPGKDIRLIH